MAFTHLDRAGRRRGGRAGQRQTHRFDRRRHCVRREHASASTVSRARVLLDIGQKLLLGLRWHLHLPRLKLGSDLKDGLQNEKKSS